MPNLFISLILFSLLFLLPCQGFAGSDSTVVTPPMLTKTFNAIATISGSSLWPATNAGDNSSNHLSQYLLSNPIKVPYTGNYTLHFHILLYKNNGHQGGHNPLINMLMVQNIGPGSGLSGITGNPILLGSSSCKSYGDDASGYNYGTEFWFNLQVDGTYVAGDCTTTASLNANDTATGIVWEDHLESVYVDTLVEGFLTVTGQ